MAEQIISPGVFTRENDLSFLPQGIGAIGAAIIGPTEKGPAFVPTVITSFADFERRFGGLSSDTFVPQTVREYLKNAGSVTVCRVLAGGGYSFKNGTTEPAVLITSQSGTTPGIILGVIYPSKFDGTPDVGETVIAPAQGHIISSSFDIKISGSNITTKQFSASLNPSNKDYLFQIIGDNPNNSKDGSSTYTATTGYPGYTYTNFKKLQESIFATDSLTGYGTQAPGSGSAVVVATMSATDMEFNGITTTTEKYSYASTPWIHSQIAKGRKQLFKLHTLSHGSDENMNYKITISNLQEPGDIDGVEQYSRFSLTIRKFDDDDKDKKPLEQYNNLSLDPDSPNYIARKIGDRYPQYNDTLDKVELLGNYPNISKYVRVEVDQAVAGKATSPKLSPKGFAAIYNPIATASLSLNAVYPSASYEGVQQTGTSGTYNINGTLGWKFVEKAQDNDNFLRPLPTSPTADANVSGHFSVENYSGHASSSLWSGSLRAAIDVTGATGPAASQLKFSVPFQGGTDGIAPWTVKFTGAEDGTLSSTYTDGDTLYGFDMNATNAAGFLGYKKAIDILSNQDEYDINMVALPGVIKEYHSLVTAKAIDMCEARGDAFYVMDLAGKESSVNNAVSVVAGLDTNYAAVYYPWVKVLDTAANKPILVPPSVIVPGAIAKSDAIGFEWFAPAGLNRGILGNVLEAKIRLNQAERDILYDNKINPIATFPQTGVCIWGQKTLQERSTALDRINVRRLLIAVKKFIASSSKYLVFEQNTLDTRNRFLNIVNPYLESIQQKQGLFAFRVVMDESNNTPDVIDRNELLGAIYLQPTKTAEFIVLDFNVLPTGATFPA